MHIPCPMGDVGLSSITYKWQVSQIDMQQVDLSRTSICPTLVGRGLTTSFQAHTIDSRSIVDLMIVDDLMPIMHLFAMMNVKSALYGNMS